MTQQEALMIVVAAALNWATKQDKAVWTDLDKALLILHAAITDGKLKLED